MTASVAFLTFTYLIAAVPFGLVVTTLYGGDADIRHSGSGNVGATNVARVYGWRLAGWVITLDAAKGLLPVLLGGLLWPERGIWWQGSLLLTAFLAHCFSVYLEFRGGKGVATGAGGLLALSPWVTVPAVAVWITLLAGTGRSSIAALGSALSVIGLAWWLHPQVLPVVAALGAGILVTHIPNIRRLIAGTEKQVVPPVRWNRPTQSPAGATLLAQGPTGGAAPSLWREAAEE